MLKTPIYRNKKLLQLANKAPHCFECLAPNEGQVVACHSNLQKDGKGMGIKANDNKICYLCHLCHNLMDSDKRLTKTQRAEMFERNHRLTMDWLFISGNVIVK